jgi:hypothetical protein
MRVCTLELFTCNWILSKKNSSFNLIQWERTKIIKAKSLNCSHCVITEQQIGIYIIMWRNLSRRKMLWINMNYLRWIAFHYHFHSNGMQRDCLPAVWKLSHHFSCQHIFISFIFKWKFYCMQASEWELSA